MLQLNNYPYTNFSELNLDYILKKVHAHSVSIAELEKSVKKVSIVNNSILKVDYYDDHSDVYALPSGNHFLVDLYDENEETISIFDLNVGDSETYNTSLTDYTGYADSLYGGIPVTMRYIPGGAGTLISCVNTIAANPNPSFMIWDDNNDTWKVFTLGIGADNKAYVERVY